MVPITKQPFGDPVPSFPQTEAGKRALAQQVAKLHADFVIAAIEQWECSPEQKRQGLEAIIQAAMQELERAE